MDKVLYLISEHNIALFRDIWQLVNIYAPEECGQVSPRDIYSPLFNSFVGHHLQKKQYHHKLLGMLPRVL